MRGLTRVTTFIACAWCALETPVNSGFCYCYLAQCMQLPEPYTEKQPSHPYPWIGPARSTQVSQRTQFLWLTPFVGQLQDCLFVTSGLPRESKLWIDTTTSSVSTVEHRNGGQEQSGSRVCLNTRGGKLVPLAFVTTFRLRLGKPNLGLPRGTLHKRLN